MPKPLHYQATLTNLTNLGEKQDN